MARDWPRWIEMKMRRNEREEDKAAFAWSCFQYVRKAIPDWAEGEKRAFTRAVARGIWSVIAEMIVWHEEHPEGEGVPPTPGDSSHTVTAT